MFTQRTPGLNAYLSFRPPARHSEVDDFPLKHAISGLVKNLSALEKLTFFHRPMAPFRLDLSVWILRRRSENVIDRWDGQTYRRVLTVENQPLEVAIGQVGVMDAPRLRVTVVGENVPSSTKVSVTTTIERLLGTRADLRPFYRVAAPDRRLMALARKFRGAKPSRFATVFEALINGITCQQLSLSLGIRMLNRLAEAFGLSTFRNGLRQCAFPRAQDLAGLRVEDIRSLGLNRQKGRAMIELSSLVVDGRLNLEGLEDQPDSEVVRLLCGLRGIGRWTAEYVLLRGLGRLHIFPGDDVGTRNLLQRWLRLRKPLDYQGVHRILAPWHGYAGLIYFHLLMNRLYEKGEINRTPQTGRDQPRSLSTLSQ